MMKKAIKKLLAALLAVAMLCAMAVPAFADSNSTTYTITINGAIGTYEAYQIFSGTLSSDGKLSDVQWGSGVDAAKATAAYGTASSKADELSLLPDAKDFAYDLASKDILNTTVSGTYANGKITGLEAGYYLVKHVDGSIPDGTDKFYSDFIIEVVKNVDVNQKGDVPSFEKKVEDINDSNTSDYTNWQDSADHDLNDAVPFKLTATIADNFADYTVYKFVFHDDQSAGLTFNPNSVKVTVGGVEMDSGYTVKTSDLTDGCTFEIEIPNLVGVSGASAGADVVVTYTATLNDDAVMGEAGNPNQARLEYSNNPHGTSTGKTNWDKVIVFTYNVTANKVDNEHNTLKGAAFALYKKDASGNYNPVGLSNATGNEGIGYTIVDAEATSFTWNRIDDGEYMIKEIITPEGYNTIADQYFTVSATHDETSDNPKLNSLSGNKATGSIITFTSNKTQGSLSTDVINKAGATLPSTGGMGTTLFYVVGGGLMVAAIVLLITKKRMENK